MKEPDPKNVRRIYVVAKRLKGGQYTLYKVFELWEGYVNGRGGGGFKIVSGVYEKQSNGLGKRYATKKEAWANIPHNLMRNFAPIRG